MSDDLVKRLRTFYLPPEDMTQADFMRLEAADRIEALMAERQWQPIETAPKDGTMVLLWGPYCSNVAVAAWGRAGMHDSWVCVADGSSAVEYMSDFSTQYATFEVPTHWMPLPAPPALEGK